MKRRKLVYKDKVSEDTYLGQRQAPLAFSGVCRGLKILCSHLQLRSCDIHRSKSCITRYVKDYLTPFQRKEERWRKKKKEEELKGVLKKSHKSSLAFE